jgi:hypothetical protein
MVHVLGAYRLDITPKLFAQAMAWKFGDLSLSVEERAAAEAHVGSELFGAVLIEVEVLEADGRFFLPRGFGPGCVWRGLLE